MAACDVSHISEIYLISFKGNRTRETIKKNGEPPLLKLNYLPLRCMLPSRRLCQRYPLGSENNCKAATGAGVLCYTNFDNDLNNFSLLTQNHVRVEVLNVSYCLLRVFNGLYNDQSCHTYSDTAEFTLGGTACTSAARKYTFHSRTGESFEVHFRNVAQA